MIDWTDQAIVLSLAPHGEHAAIVSLFTRSYGRHGGFVPGGQSRKMRAQLQSGALVQARWRARLETQIGTLALEPLSGTPSPVLLDRVRLAGLASMLSLLDSFLAERDPHPALYDACLQTFAPLMRESAPAANWGGAIARWECLLLSELGFGLDLSCCALTGTTHDLAWVSPITGRTASRMAGAPWADRLIRLPAFLMDDTPPKCPQDLYDAFHLSGHFLSRLEPMGWGRKTPGLPDARERFLWRLRTHLKDQAF